MERTSPRTMDFFDRHVSSLIAKDNRFDELKSLRLFMESETYGMLSDETLKLWHLSPLAIYDMWLQERETGDPRNSLYIKGAEGRDNE